MKINKISGSYEIVVDEAEFHILRKAAVWVLHRDKRPFQDSQLDTLRSVINSLSDDYIKKGGDVK